MALKLVWVVGWAIVGILAVVGKNVYLEVLAFAMMLFNWLDYLHSK